MSPGLPPGLSAQMPCPRVLVTLEAPEVAAPGGYLPRGHRAACERAGSGLPAGGTYTVAKTLTEGGCFSQSTHVYVHTHTHTPRHTANLKHGQGNQAQGP